MPRRPSVRFFDSRNAYYCQHNGKQYKLGDGPDDFGNPPGPNYTRALHAFTQLTTLGTVESEKDRNPVRAILEVYMRHAHATMAPGTLHRRVRILGCFADALGDCPVADLTHFKVLDFIAQMRKASTAKGDKWGDGTVANFVANVNTAFNWAVKSGLLLSNPMRFLPKPSVRSRSRECLITPEQHQSILNASRSKAFKAMVICLKGTGCRPGELCNAKASDWDEAVRGLHYYSDHTRLSGEFRHKTAKKRDRIIRFRGEPLDVIRELMKQHPTGPLFLTVRGNAWTVEMLSKVFRWIRLKVEMPHLTPYSYRHSYATAWLTKGKPIEVLAQTLGSSAEVIRKHYSHIEGEQVDRHVDDFSW
jgi:integrase